ncbi:hypothetical protein ACJMK2_005056 [Sinanodonta woodiana]|uniref:Uncharacterized protein n=1 Tax=Sinanodonta woodiana TaxID=1069815 RepID=A0ABD3VQ63_SINWO
MILLTSANISAANLSKHVQLFLIQRLKSTIHSLGRFSGPFWFGLHAPNASDLNTFTWDDCSVPVYLNNLSSEYPPSFDPCVHIELQRELFNGVFTDEWLKGQNCNHSLPMVCETEILAINYNVTISETYSLSTCLTVENIPTISSDLHPSTGQTALCTCPCDKTTTKPLSSKNLLKLILGTVLKFKAVWTMDVKNTSRARMRKECAKDNRPSSVSVGVIGMAIVCVPLGLLVISDLPKLYAESKKMRKNVRSAFRKKTQITDTNVTNSKKL